MMIDLRAPGVHSVTERLQKVIITAENVAEQKELVQIAARISMFRTPVVPAATQEQPAGSGATHGWTGTCCENGNMGQPHICCKSPGNLPPNVVDLRTRMFKLDRLLLDPHPGLSTWVTAYGNAAKHLLQFFDEANAIPAPGSPRKVGEDGAGEKYERTHSRAWVNAWNAALEEVCGLVAVNGSELDFGPFSIGHNPKRVQQEHTMIVELIRALKHPVPALRSSSVPVGEQKQEEGV